MTDISPFFKKHGFLFEGGQCSPETISDLKKVRILEKHIQAQNEKSEEH